MAPAVCFSLHLATHARYGYFRDELYYLACGRRLAWGYVDHPPFTPAVARLIEQTVGPSLLGLRIVPALAIATTALMAGLMARRMGGGRVACLIAGLCVAMSPAYLSLGTFLSVNAFDLVAWAAGQWVVLCWLQDRRPVQWILLGGILGLGLLNKYTVLFLGVGLAAGVLMTPQRSVLKSAWPWIAVAVALLIVLPNLMWQAAHGWPTVEFLRNIRADKNYPVNPIEFAAMQFAVLHPVIFVYAVIGLVGLFRTAALKPYRLFGWSYLTVFVILMSQHAKFYYLFAAYPVIFAAGGIVLERWTSERRRRIGVLFGALIVLTVPTWPYAVPLLPIKTFDRYNAAIQIQHHLRFEKHRRPSQPIVFSDMIGWPELAARVGERFEQLPAADRRQCVILCADYGVAGAVEMFDRDRGLPEPVAPHNSYYLWGPGQRPWTVVLAVGFDAATLERYFADVRRLDTVTNRYARESPVSIHLCRQPLRSRAAIFQALKRFR